MNVLIGMVMVSIALSWQLATHYSDGTWKDFLQRWSAGFVFFLVLFYGIILILEGLK